MDQNDLRLIEAGFPCHQVGAETQRERGASSALPPLYYLHVWWARRPLTPSRAAILASLLPADADPQAFVKELGIRVLVADVQGVDWVLGEDKLRERVVTTREGRSLNVDEVVQRALMQERAIRRENRLHIDSILSKDETLKDHHALIAWLQETLEIPTVQIGDQLIVREAMGNPAWAKEKMALTKHHKVRFAGDPYHYPRAFSLPTQPVDRENAKVILDPTAGGGSIPFEALRLGHRVIVNELNPVASVILKATLDYPARYGLDLREDIQRCADSLLKQTEKSLQGFFGLGQHLQDVGQPIPSSLNQLSEDEASLLSQEDIVDYLYCRQVTCPHCGGDTPLLNSLWLSKEGEQWAVEVLPQADKTVLFEPYVLGSDGRKPNTRTLDAGTVTRGVGQCVHCHQAIAGDEIKRQARGESELGRWQDVLYCVVGIRLEPKLNKHGEVQRFASGTRKGEIKTRKVRYFRGPNGTDQQALTAAAADLEARRFDFEMKGLVPNEESPPPCKQSQLHQYGFLTWAELFMPRQLLGHLTVMEALSDTKPRILEEQGEERGRAVVTYLQVWANECDDVALRREALLIDYEL